ncbi:MAG: replication-associated recombination protein A [Micrococcales bacterium]
MTSSSLDFAVPLATRMRPISLAELVGQTHLLQAGSPLRSLCAPSNSDSKLATPSVILWGPPGTGKTTLAQVIARSSARRFVELSAISAGVKEVREIMLDAKLRLENGQGNTLLFLDEIHRFSKAQQDSLLPGVEAGWVTLVAATTENPSFSVIAPLLSRSLLLTLEAISNEDIETLVLRALKDRRGLQGEFKLEPKALDQLVLLAQGDARRALTVLEAAASVARENSANTISTEFVATAMDHAIARYDRAGDQHYDIISAFIKSVRGSDADAAIHWLARMIDAGEDPRFIARRLVILASEDIGLADPQAIVIATSVFDAVAQIGMPEGRIPLAEATIYLALAPKSNSAYNAINLALEDVRAGQNPAVPKPLRSSNYSGAKAQGNGVGYQYPHDNPLAVVPQEYLPAKLKGRRYFVAKEIGFERDLKARWEKLRAIIRGEK